MKEYVSASLEGIATFDLDGGGDVIGVGDIFVDLISVNDSKGTFSVADERAASIAVTGGQVVDIGPE